MMLNIQPQHIVPTLGSFVLDELYVGHCVQVGGTMGYFANPTLGTDVYIKTADETGKMTYLKFTIMPREKVIFDVIMTQTSPNADGSLFTDFHVSMFMLNANERYNGFDAHSSQALGSSLVISSNDGVNFNFPDTSTILASLNDMGISATVVDKPTQNKPLYLAKLEQYM